MSWKVAPGPAWQAEAGSSGVTPSLFWIQASTKLCWFPQPQAPAMLGNWFTALLLTETDRSSWFGLLVFLPQSVKGADQLLAQPVGREWLLGTISPCSQELAGDKNWLLARVAGRVIQQLGRHITAGNLWPWACIQRISLPYFFGWDKTLTLKWALSFETSTCPDLIAAFITYGICYLVAETYGPYYWLWIK